MMMMMMMMMIIIIIIIITGETGSLSKSFARFGVYHFLQTTL